MNALPLPTLPPPATVAQPVPEPPLHETIALFAGVLAGGTLRLAARRLVAAIAADRGYSRVSLALRRDGRTELVAVSNLEPATGEAELPQLLLGAMNEAMEQQATLVAPPDLADGRWIGLEHEQLRRKVGGTVVTVPLGVDGAVIGALCIEQHADLPIPLADRLQLERTLVLAAPVLQLMQHNEDPWHRRARRSAHAAWTALRQPERRRTRWVLGTLALAFTGVAAVPFDHEVAGRARVEGAEQRVLVAPTDGFLKTSHVRPGDRVLRGAALADLMERDLRLERERWASQLAQHENAYAAAMARTDRALAAVSLSRISEAQSQLSLVDEQLVRGQISAPFDGIVIQGDLSQSIGAPVRQGDPLLTVATTGRYRVIVDVDETDIARVQPGQKGVAILSALPWDTQPVVVERITPLAKAVDGRNVFEVQTRLLATGAELRPGLQGRGRLVVGSEPPLWVWTRHVVDRMRLAWWSMLG